MSKPVKFGPPASTFGFGLLMGAADAVPGVSGGTIALILGIYRKLISSISSCLFFVKENFPSHSRADFITAFNFLFPLACGMLFSYYMVTKILVGPYDSPGLLRQASTAPYVFSFFSGLVLFSIREPWRYVHYPETKHYLLAVAGISIILVYSSLALDPGSKSMIWFIVGGALALTAMLLPGISGALVLLTLGQYTVVANAVHDLNLNIMFYFLSGGLIGLFTFVPFMNFMLLNYKEDVMSVLTGLMLGSLATLWPWKESYDSKGVSPNLGIGEVFENFELVSIIGTICFGFLGFGLYLVLKNLEKR